MAEAVLKMKDEGDPEPNSSLPRWELVCEALGASFKGNDLVDLRRRAKNQVDKEGDPRVDYRFTKYDHGRNKGTIVIVSAKGLVAFGRRKMRQAS